MARTKRSTDQDERPVFRSDRFFSGNGQWYFATRERIDIGPFRRRDQAEDALERFIAAANLGEADGQSAR